MKPVNFDYARPKDVEASLSLLAERRTFRQGRGRQSVARADAQHAAGPARSARRYDRHRRAAAGRRGRPTASSSAPASPTPTSRTAACPDVTGGALPSVAARHRLPRRAQPRHDRRQPDPRRSVGGLDLDSRRAWRVGDAARPAEARARSPSRITCSARLRRISGQAKCSFPSRRRGSAGRPDGAITRSAARLANSRMRSELFVVDPDRGVCRAVIGATETRPIVIADARAIIADGAPERFDGQSGRELASSPA